MTHPNTSCHLIQLMCQCSPQRPYQSSVFIGQKIAALAVPVNNDICHRERWAEQEQRPAMDSLAQWLEELGLGQYAAVFAANDVDRILLLELTEGDLERLGLSLGH